MLNSRVLRRRWVLAVIFGCSLLYFIVSIYKQADSIDTHFPTVNPRKIPLATIDWQPKFNGTSIKTCRNSVQGRLTITDERGYTCKRENVLVGGCCDTSVPSTRQFICDSCLSNGCCSVYEDCVSCCLQPEKQPLLRKILNKATDSFQHLFASVTDHFELCLAKCRTSSQSVQHENSYRDPAAKFCYGENPPDLQPIAL